MPSGEERMVHVAVGKPYWTTKSTYACPVSLDGLWGHISDIHSDDSLSALTLAIEFMQRMLKRALDKGIVFRMPDTNEPIDPMIFFPFYKQHSDSEDTQDAC
jgi:hypothetical protein